MVWRPSLSLTPPLHPFARLCPSPSVPTPSAEMSISLSPLPPSKAENTIPLLMSSHAGLCYFADALPKSLHSFASVPPYCNTTLHNVSQALTTKTLICGMGLVPEGTAANASGISLRAGGVTEAAANGIARELQAGHGRWKSLSGPEAYDRQDQRKYAVVSDALQQGMQKAKNKSRCRSTLEKRSLESGTRKKGK